MNAPVRTHFELPSTSREQPPQFVDAASCQAWCRQLPAKLPVQTQAQLLRQLHLLNRYCLAAADRLLLLEVLRTPIHAVQADIAHKFVGKPLPLAPPEQAALDTACNLWQALAVGYLHCLAAVAETTLAQACQRALAALIDGYVDRLRAGLHVDALHWRRVHGAYAIAEAQGVARRAVEDGLRHDKPLSAAAQYVEQMLLAAAGLHELTPRQQGWAMRWARRWATKPSIAAALPPPTRALPLCVDIDSETAVGFKPCTGPGARFIDTVELRKSLRGRIERLASGDPAQTPAALGLGADCDEPATSELLRRLYPRWVKGGRARRDVRETLAAAPPCRFVVGVDAIHYYLSGLPFKQPGSISSETLRRQREQLATFDCIISRFEDAYSRQHGFQLESWQTLEDWNLRDQSGGGLRIARPLDQLGGRLAIGQLVAVRPGAARDFLLGMVRWAQIREGELSAGIQLFPGIPWAVAVRPTGVMAARETYRPGFVIPATDALQTAQSVVLPPGGFKPGRSIEAWTPEGSARLKLDTLLERGVDFERARCVDTE